MESLFIVKDNIYSRQTLLYTSYDKDVFYDFVQKEFGVFDYSDVIDDYFEKDSTAYARTIFRNNIVIILIKHDYMTPAVLAHECFHAVEYHFEKIGLPHSETSSEAWAYYLAFLVRRFNEEIDSFRKNQEAIDWLKSQGVESKGKAEFRPFQVVTPYNEREDVGMDKFRIEMEQSLKKEVVDCSPEPNLYVNVEFFKESGKYYLGFSFDTILPIFEIDKIKEEAIANECFIPKMTFTIEVRSRIDNSFNKYLYCQPIETSNESIQR